jgi:Uri superfamily endonuclease
MMKIYLYGYQNSIRSCRKLEKACKNNIEMMWLVHEQQPHYRTIAKFRKDNSKAFKAVFRHFVTLLKGWDLIEGKTIAVDSFKIRAQNSLKNNYNEKKIKRHIDYIDKKIAEYEQYLEEEFDKDIDDKLKHNKEKKGNYQKIRQQLKDSKDGQISLTDPDSKAVVFQRNSVKVGYNIQAASDAKHKMLVAADTGDVNDTKSLGGMVLKVKENIGEPEDGSEMNVLADKGYHTGRELKKCDEQNVKTFVSPKESNSLKTNPDFAPESFIYDKENDVYICPAGEVLRTNGSLYTKNKRQGQLAYKSRHYKTKACMQCALKSKCTKSKRYRYIERSEFQQYIEENNARVYKKPNYYRQRQQIIEHQFGTIKRHYHFDYLLTKGKEKVMGEVYLVFTVYNLKRALSVLGFDALMRRIYACLRLFLASYDQFIAHISRFKQSKHNYDFLLLKI